MGNSQNIIELNGKRYDTLTGRMLNSTKPKPKTRHPVPGQVMDGVTHQKVAHQPPAVHKLHKKVEKSHTLMRSGVRKPLAPSSSHGHIQDRKSHPKPTIPKPALLHPTTSPARFARADHIKKSALISKFGSVSSRSSVTKKMGPLPVQPEPTVVPALPSNLSHHSSALSKTANHHAVSTALANASSHKQSKVKHHAKLHHRVARKLHISPKILNVSALVAAFLLISGFFAYQNLPNINMRIAASRSGVHGNLPGYQPAGFALKSEIEYKPGQIILNFKSNSDEREFKIVQESSDWNSETLKDNLATQGKSPQARQKQGKTIYIYDGSRAAWVSGGVKYEVDGSTTLNTNQLLHIADSL